MKDNKKVDDKIKELLIDKSDLTIVNNENENALFIAVKYSNSVNIIKRILHRLTDLDIKFSTVLLDESGFNVLHYFCANKDIFYKENEDIILDIINVFDENVNLYTQTYNNKTNILMQTISSGKSNKIIKLLIEKTIEKSDINLGDKDNITPLKLAIMHKNEEIIKILLEKKINIDKTIIEFAKKYNISKETIDLIVNKMIDNNQNIDNDILVFCITNNIKTETIKRILEKKIDIDINVLEYAKKYNISKELIDLIINKIIDDDKNIHNIDSNILVFCITNNINIETIKKILDKNKNISKLLENNKTILMLAIQNNTNKEIIFKMLELIDDKNINNVDVNNNNILLYALYYNLSNEIIEIIINKGININQINRNNENALMIALENRYNMNCIKLLLDRNIDINLKNKNGQTPLMIELNNRNNLDIIKLLLLKDNSLFNLSIYSETENNVVLDLLLNKQMNNFINLVMTYDILKRNNIKIIDFIRTRIKELEKLYKHSKTSKEKLEYANLIKQNEYEDLIKKYKEIKHNLKLKIKQELKQELKKK
jgi:hypothetical protein